jgi:hypothetical protein
MPHEFHPEAAYDQALALNTAAAATDHFEASYHFLMAAFHCAEDLQDRGRFAEVAERALAQQKAADAIAPPHRLSPKRTHGGHGIHELAAVAGEAVVKRLESQRRIAAQRRLA